MDAHETMRRTAGDVEQYQAVRDGILSSSIKGRMFLGARFSSAA